MPPALNVYQLLSQIQCMLACLHMYSSVGVIADGLVEMFFFISSHIPLQCSSMLHGSSREPRPLPWAGYLLNRWSLLPDSLCRFATLPSSSATNPLLQRYFLACLTWFREHITILSTHDFCSVKLACYHQLMHIYNHLHSHSQYHLSWMDISRWGSLKIALLRTWVISHFSHQQSCKCTSNIIPDISGISIQKFGVNTDLCVSTPSIRYDN